MAIEIPAETIADTPTSKTEANPVAPHSPAKVKREVLVWVNIFLMLIIVITVNYISCSQYGRRDLTEDQRYDISSTTINLLQSDMVQKRENPLKIIFAFQRSTPNYTRMRSLLEEYVRYGKGKVTVEYVDPLRQPNRARQIALIYKAKNIEFRHNQVLIDARKDTSKEITTYEGDVPDVINVRVCNGDSFVLYEDRNDGRGMKAIALQMESIITANLISAIEGVARKVYIPQDKSDFSSDLIMGKEIQVTEKDSLIVTLGQIAASLNLQLIPITLNGLKEIPQDAAAVILAGSKYDLTKEEKDVLVNYWLRPKSGIFVFLNPQAKNLKFLYNFLREQGVRPHDDRILLKNRQQAYYHLNAIFCPSLTSLKDFWNKSTNVEGESISMSVDEDLSHLAERRINLLPLIQTTDEFYGETKYAEPNAKFDSMEDYPGPLVLSIGVQRGNTQDINLAKNTARMAVLGNVDMLKPSVIKSDQKDYVRAILAWITDREELSGKSPRHDMTIKLDLNKDTLFYVQLITNIIMPLLALAIGLMIWNTRRH